MDLMESKPVQVLASFYQERKGRKMVNRLNGWDAFVEGDFVGSRETRQEAEALGNEAYAARAALARRNRETESP